MLCAAIKTANKKGYDLARGGDAIDLAYPNSKTRRGRVGHGIAKTIETGGNMGVIEFRTKNKRIIETAEKARFTEGTTAYLDVYNKTPRHDVTSTINAGTDSHQNNIIVKDFRIRKLTPKECWRLMGFDDKDFRKAEKVCSNTQLYKQAGNSIVVNVLMGILNNLLGSEHED
jgi:DNA (cytosine-5)-methyltransferase 1